MTWVDRCECQMMLEACWPADYECSAEWIVYLLWLVWYLAGFGERDTKACVGDKCSCLWIDDCGQPKGYDFRDAIGHFQRFG